MKAYFNYNVDDAMKGISFDSSWIEFMPNTWFFIIDSNIDYFLDMDHFNNRINLSLSDPNYKNDPINTDLKYFLNESNLRECIRRNKLKCKHLLKKETYKNLLESVVNIPIVDSSFKNIYFSEIDLCHYQFYNENVFQF
jgi:hypothetical protein